MYKVRNNSGHYLAPRLRLLEFEIWSSRTQFRSFPRNPYTAVYVGSTAADLLNIALDAGSPFCRQLYTLTHRRVSPIARNLILNVFGIRAVVAVPTRSHRGFDPQPAQDSVTFGEWQPFDTVTFAECPTNKIPILRLLAMFAKRLGVVIDPKLS